MIYLFYVGYVAHKLVEKHPPIRFEGTFCARVYCATFLKLVGPVRTVWTQPEPKYHRNGWHVIRDLSHSVFFLPHIELLEHIPFVCLFVCFKMTITSCDLFIFSFLSLSCYIDFQAMFYRR